jgi:hypothetical protein
MTKSEALAEYLECDESSLREVPHDPNAFQVGNHEYLVLTDEESDQICELQIKDSLWAFNTEFIARHTLKRLKPGAIKALKKVQEELCEDANDLVECLIHSMDKFVRDAIRADGRAHFLGTYDGEEIEFKEYFIYKVS